VTGKKRIALEAAEIVLNHGVVYTRTRGDPFFFSSGWASPVFIDIKRLISNPQAREQLLTLALRKIDEEIGSAEFDQIAGCELAGVPFAAMIADRLSLPFIIALKQAKGFGRLSQCEGDFEPGARTLLLDDVTTDGGTKTTFKTALERAEAKVIGIFVLFAYDIFPGSPQITSLMTLADIIEVAKNNGQLDASTRYIIQEFAENAPKWSKRNGGIGEH
jgi:orotate phosphoribosyltransferase